MAVSQIGNGDFPLNNCAILRQILPETSLDFLKTVLRGEAFANPIADLAGNVRNNIGSALSKIGTLSNADSGGSFFGEMNDTLESLRGKLIEFEARTNRMSGVISGFEEGKPDLGRILGIGSAYNSALATLASNPEDILKDNFSHGFNSLKQEFGINAIQESDSAITAAGNFLAQFGLGYNPGGGTEPAFTFVEPNPFEFYNEAQQILGNVRSIQQSITNIENAEDAFLAGALAFLEDFALANTALSGVLTDPCMAGKIIGMIASGDLESLIPDIPEPTLPTLDEILDNIPDPEDIADAVAESVEGIVESVQEQVTEIIDTAAEVGKETVAAIQKSAEEIIEAGEQLVEQAEQAAKDLATNVENFGKDVDKFFEDLENRLNESEEDAEESESEESSETIEASEAEVRETYNQVNELWLQALENRSGPSATDILRGIPLNELESALATAEPGSLFYQDVASVIEEKQPPPNPALQFRDTAYFVRDTFVTFAEAGGFSDVGIGAYPASTKARTEYLASSFTLEEIEKTLLYYFDGPADPTLEVGGFNITLLVEANRLLDPESASRSSFDLREKYGY